MCVPARWSSGISAHQNVECGSAQCTLGNGAFVRGYKLCMVVVAYVWYIETSLVAHKKRICIGLLIIKGASQFLANSIKIGINGVME